MKEKLLSSIAVMVLLLCNIVSAQANDTATTSVSEDFAWRVYLDNQKLSGEQMYIYMWDAGNNDAQLLGNFPGKPMTFNSETNLWEYSFSTATNLITPMVIFSNGMGEQTADLTFYNGNTYYLAEILIDGVYYAIKDDILKTAEVTFKGNTFYEYSGEYMGAVNIASKINFKGNDYAVTSIGRYAFYGCYDLTEVVIPESVEIIDRNAFFDCVGLKSVTLSKNVSTICSYAFLGAGLTELHLEATTPPIVEADAFGEQHYNMPVYVPKGCVDAYKASDYWMNFTTIVEEGTVTYTWRTQLQNTKLSGNNIYVYMWDEGDNNRELLGKWPGTPMRRNMSGYWEYSFSTTTDLISPMIIFNNGNGEQTDDLVFKNDSLYKYLLTIEDSNFTYDVLTKGDVFSPAAVSITSDKGCVGDVVIPETFVIGLNDYMVVSIEDNVFKGNTQITSVTIPCNMRNIGSHVFDGCTSLTKVVWNAISCSSASVYDDGTWYLAPPFMDYTTFDSNVEEVIFGDEVTYVPVAMCMNMSKLKNVKFPDKVTTIDEYAFNYCSSLESVTIPENVLYVGSMTFNDCVNLKSVTWNAINCNNYISNSGPMFYNYDTQSSAVEQFVFGENVECIPVYLCSGMSKLTSINIPKTVKEIGDFAFYQSGLQSVAIPQSVQKLGMSAFWNCSELAEVTLSEGLTQIGDYAFSRCYKLASINVPNSVVSLGNEAFWSCSSLKSAVIGDGVTHIGDYTFSRCESLTTVTLGVNLETMGQEVFWNCSSLKFITLPASLREIGQYCFENCSSLVDVYAHPLVPPTIYDNTFPVAIAANATLHTTKGYKADYENAIYWKNFGSIVDDITSGIDATNVNEDLCLSVVGGVISITGVPNDAVVKVYNTNGALLHHTTVAGAASIVLPRGIYIIQVGNIVKKLRV